MLKLRRKDQVSRFDPKNNVWVVDAATEPMFGATINEGKSVVIHNIHAASLCEGRHCVVHNPSNHHMLNWKLVWRADKGVAERMCKHGIGHPDPDDADYLVSVNKSYLTVHGCDGCCHGS